MFIKNLSWNILTLIFSVFHFYLYALFTIYRFFYVLNIMYLTTIFFFFFTTILTRKIYQYSRKMVFFKLNIFLTLNLVFLQPKIHVKLLYKALFLPFIFLPTQVKKNSWIFISIFGKFFKETINLYDDTCHKIYQLYFYKHKTYNL